MTQSNNGDPLDLDLIAMVQRARMNHDDHAQPSQVSAVYWIEAKAPNASPTPHAGAWVIPTRVTEVDALWAKVKTATEAGKLGYKSKVSTSPAKEQGHPNERVVHVRVADSRDAADMQRVQDHLLALGIDNAHFVPDKAE